MTDITLIPERECWLPTVVEADGGAATASRYFGRPWLAAAEKWPKIDGTPLLFVLQFDVASLPEPMSRLLGGKGLFQLFYPGDSYRGNTWEGDGALARLVFPDEVPGAIAEVIPESVLAEAEAIRGQEPWTPKLIVGWEARMDKPHQEERIGVPDLYELSEADGFDETLLDCIQGDKLGGWPYWTQACERVQRASNGDIVFLDEGAYPPPDGEEMIPFLQLDAGCFFDGTHGTAHAPGLFAADGTLHVSVLPSDPRIMAIRWACT